MTAKANGFWSEYSAELLMSCAISRPSKSSFTRTSKYSTQIRAHLHFIISSHVDVDECNEDTADCGDDTYCHNTPGSYNCRGEKDETLAIL